MWSSFQIRLRFVYIGWIPHTYAAHFMDFSGSWWTLIKHSNLIQMQETTTMFHEFNDIGRNSDSCWFSPSIRDFPLKQRICIQLRNRKRIKRTQWLQRRCKLFPAFAMKTQISPCGNTFHLYCKPSDWQKFALLLMRKAGWVTWVDISWPVVFYWTVSKEQGCVMFRMELRMIQFRS